MIPVEEYLADPCRKLSIPYWKAKRISVPPGVKIIHGSEFSEKMLDNYTDTAYFRLMHSLEHIPVFRAPDIVCRAIGPERMEDVADMINRCYTHSGIRVSVDTVKSWMDAEVYCPALWTGAFSGETMAGSIICEFDHETGEAAIEWLQVLPEYRNRGIAAALVCRALDEMQKFADFATVSGECSNVTAPERVYRRCGFTGGDVWHILQEKVLI